MRVHWFLAVALLGGCAGEKLALAPPPGVDLTGHWKLNVADSDDPVRLAQMRNLPTGGAGAASGAGGGGGGGGGGRRGRGGQSQGAGAGAGAVATGPSIPPVASFAEVLQWPGNDLDIRQSGAAAVFDSDGSEQDYAPAPAAPKGSGSQQIVGWDDKSLVIEMPGDADRPALTERFRLSEDGQRLLQVVSVKGGRSSGFTMSRVWDRR